MTEEDPFAQHRTYKGIRCIGRGGAGVVWEIEHRQLANRLAAKLIHHHLVEDDQMMERLALEAKTQARVRHRNLVGVQDMGTASDGRPFYVMPLLKGRALDVELSQRGELPLREARQIMLQVLDGLAALHDEGLLHRDVKPSNIFICDGKPRVIKLVDLGVVKVTEASRVVKPMAAPTKAGMTVGTPRYMSPEQARAGRLDARADLYSAGLVMYKMIAGRGPFDDNTTVGTMLLAHVFTAPAAPSMFAEQTVGRELEDVILTALAKDPSDRHASAREFATALQRVRLDLRDSLSAIDASPSPLPVGATPRNATVLMEEPPTEPLDSYTITVPVNAATDKIPESASDALGPDDSAPDGAEMATRRIKSR